MEVVLGAAVAKKLEAVPLSNDTIGRRVSEGVVERVIQIFFPSSWTIPTGRTPVFTFLPGQTKGSDIFRALDHFIESNGIPWRKCVGVCTDGAPTMLGKHIGLITEMKKRNEEERTRMRKLSSKDKAVGSQRRDGRCRENRELDSE